MSGFCRSFSEKCLIAGNSHFSGFSLHLGTLRLLPKPIHSKNKVTNIFLFIWKVKHKITQSSGVYSGFSQFLHLIVFCAKFTSNCTIINIKCVLLCVPLSILTKINTRTQFLSAQVLVKSVNYKK